LREPELKLLHISRNMILALLYLSIFSDAFLQPVLAGKLFKIPHAVPVEEGELFAKLDDFILPAPRVSVNLSTTFWEGKQFHYSIPNDSGIEEEFTIGIIDHIVSDDNESDLHDKREITTASKELSTLVLRQNNWFCHWVVGCYESVVVAVAISQNQINAVAAAVRARLTANDNRLLNRIIDNVVVSFSVSILSGVAGM
jgi:hypothetical protein